MINRIRAVRKARGMTLSELADRCDPPTTAQTIGRLETGMRTLSIDWLNRIAAALRVEAEALLTSAAANTARIVATFGADGLRMLETPREAVPPAALLQDGELVVADVHAPTGDFRAGDQIWFRKLPAAAWSQAVNREVMIATGTADIAFGRLASCDAERIVVLPAQAGMPPVVFSQIDWLAEAAMLIRRL